MNKVIPLEISKYSDSILELEDNKTKIKKNERKINIKINNSKRSNINIISSTKINTESVRSILLSSNSLVCNNDPLIELQRSKGLFLFKEDNVIQIFCINRFSETKYLFNCKNLTENEAEKNIEIILGIKNMNSDENDNNFYCELIKEKNNNSYIKYLCSCTKIEKFKIIFCENKKLIGYINKIVKSNKIYGYELRGKKNNLLFNINNCKINSFKITKYNNINNFGEINFLYKENQKILNVLFPPFITPFEKLLLAINSLAVFIDF